MCLVRERSCEGRDYTTCPVCNQPINGSPEELNEHVEYCLNRVDANYLNFTQVRAAGASRCRIEPLAFPGPTT